MLFVLYTKIKDSYILYNMSFEIVQEQEITRKQKQERKNILHQPKRKMRQNLN